MVNNTHKTGALTGWNFLTRLRRDVAGNTLAMLAAGLFPLLALVGGGIDMGRNYLSQTRLQQACDAGALAARKRLGTQVVAGGTIPTDVAEIGNRFFNLNYRAGAFGTRDRSFQMTLMPDYAIKGNASVAVPTTIMQMFGYNQIDISVACEAQLNFANSDVMFVLDTTGSMSWTNPGDSKPKIDVLRDTVHDFVTQLEGSKGPGVRMRYGFVPYSSNVNVGSLLKSDWMVDSWTYHGRESKPSGDYTTINTTNTVYTYVSGSRAAIAPFNWPDCPSSPYTSATSGEGTNPDGSTYGTTVENGKKYSCTPLANGEVSVTGWDYTDYTFTWQAGVQVPQTVEILKWLYHPMTFDTRFVKGNSGNDPVHYGQIQVPMMGIPDAPLNGAATFNGCIEERDTYEIDDYSNVDFSRALDLDLDAVPSKNNPGTQWRPLLHELSWLPEVLFDKDDFLNPNPKFSLSNYYNSGLDTGASPCPAPAQKLQEMSVSQVDAYTAGLTPSGSTYHDIGMIWGGRLLSPTGIFASENADRPGRPTSRHLIFLTDGETSPYELNYGTYGIDPMDKRRWNRENPKGGLTLSQVVEKRFTVACNEVKNRNITVWFIAFGTSINPVMTECAGPGHYFEANNAADLASAFSKIARQIGNLRVSK